LVKKYRKYVQYLRPEVKYDCHKANFQKPYAPQICVKRSYTKFNENPRDDLVDGAGSQSNRRTRSPSLHLWPPLEEGLN